MIESEFITASFPNKSSTPAVTIGTNVISNRKLGKTIKLDTEMLPDINEKQQLKPIKRVGRKKSPYIFNFEKYKEIFIDKKSNQSIV